MADAYLLSADDLTILRGVIDRERRSHQNTLQRPYVPDTIHQAPEVYVALTPAGGIPSILIPGFGTGTGSGNEPNSADCLIYRLNNLTTIPELQPVFGFTKTVYNLGADIAGDSWVLVERDKYGTWWAVPTATGGGTAAFVGAAYTTADRSIANNSVVNLIWNVRTFDTSGFIASPPSANIVVPQTGKYLITAQVEWDSNAVGRRVITIASTIFSGPYPTSQVQPLTTALDATIQQCTGILPLTAGETVNVEVLQDSGGSLTAIGTDTLFTIALIP